MRKAYIFIIVMVAIVLAMVTLAACQPADAAEIQQQEEVNSYKQAVIESFQDVQSVTPSKVLVNSDGVPQYIVYELKNSNGDLCLIITDLYGSARYGSSPAISCLP